MSMLECCTAVRWSQLVRLNALRCGIPAIRKQKVPEGSCTRSQSKWIHSHIYKPACMRHESTHGCKKLQSPHSWSSLPLLLRANVRMHDQDRARRWRWGVGEGTPGFPLPSPHANIHHMTGVMPRSGELPLMIPSTPTWGVSARRSAACHP